MHFQFLLFLKIPTDINYKLGLKVFRADISTYHLKNTQPANLTIVGSDHPTSIIKMADCFRVAQLRLTTDLYKSVKLHGRT